MKYSKVALVLGGALFLPGCFLGAGEKDPPPCVDGVFEVELLELLPESSCFPERPTDLATAVGWKFRVEPTAWSHDPNRSLECSGTEAMITTSVARPIEGTSPGSSVPGNAGLPAANATTFSSPEPDCAVSSLSTGMQFWFPAGMTALSDKLRQKDVIVGIRTTDEVLECDVQQSFFCNELYSARFSKIREL